MKPGKKGGKKKGGQKGGGEAPVITDERFSGMHSMPTFKRVKADKHKVALDDRFLGVLTDERFRVPEAKYDKYGRKQEGRAKARDDLSSFYTLEEGGGGGGGGGSDADDHADTDDYDDDAELAEAEAELEAAKDASSGGKLKKKGIKPKPAVIKRMKLKPGQTLPADEMERRLAHLNRMARGELDSGEENGSSSDDNDGDSDGNSDGDGGDGALAAAGPAQNEALVEGGETQRLAVCNLDWDHLGAPDLFKLLESFMPPGGAVIKVSIYPSDYGLERMKHEERFGPKLWSGEDDEGGGDDDDKEEEEGGEEEDGVGVIGTLKGGRDGGVRTKVGLVFGGSDDEDDDDDDEEEEDLEGLPRPTVGSRRRGAGGFGDGKDYDEDALRAYELQRAKYYFGVVECDSVATAEALYAKVDGMEWEYSSTTLDLSFIPHDTDFSGRTPRDVATKAPGAEYIAPAFVTAARQQTKVNCTWDEEEPARARALDRLASADWRRLGDDDEAGIDALIASSDDEDDDEDDDKDDDEDEDEDGGKKGKKGKGKKANKGKTGDRAKKPSRAELRKLMGLGGDSDDSDGDHDSEAERMIAGLDDDGGDGGASSGEEYTFVSGAGGEAALAAALAAKRSAKLGGGQAEETPWEKVQRKEAERKKARKQARKARLASSHRGADGDGDSDGSGGGMRNATDAEFFMLGDDVEGVGGSGGGGGSRGEKGVKGEKQGKGKKGKCSGGGGDDDEEVRFAEAEETARNYDMRAVVRAEKMAGKKLKGGRAKKEARRALEAGLVLDRSTATSSSSSSSSSSTSKAKARTATVTDASGFQIDVKDARFQAVLDGGGDGRFGLDPTDPSFKPTSGMRVVLEEQRKRRRERSDAQEKALARSGGGWGSSEGGGEGGGGGGGGGGGTAGMAALVSSLKRRALPAAGAAAGVAVTNGPPWTKKAKHGKKGHQ